MSARTIRCVLVVSALGASLLTNRPSEAGPILDWLFGHRQNYYPVGAPVAVPAAPRVVANCNPGVVGPVAPAPYPGGLYPASPLNTVRYAPAPSLFHSPVQSAPVYAAAGYPTGYSVSNFGSGVAAVSAYGPAFPTPGPAPISAYAPVIPTPGPMTVSPAAPYLSPYYVPPVVAAPVYQSNPVQVPVTTYRPVTSVDPITGQVHTTLQPCTTHEAQTQRVPYNAYRPIRGLLGRPYYDVAPNQAFYPTMMAPAPFVAPTGIPQVVSPGYGGPAVVGSSVGLDPIGPSVTTAPADIAPSLNSSAIGSPAVCPPGSEPTYNGGSRLGMPYAASPNYGAPTDGTQTQGTFQGSLNATEARPLDSGSHPISPTVREPADERPSLRDVPVEADPPTPSVSIRGPSDPGYRRVEANSSDINNSRRSESGSSTPFPWRLAPPNDPNANRRSNARPIPDPDKPSVDSRTIAPPRLLDPNDKTVMRTNRDAHVTRTSYVEVKQPRAAIEKPVPVIEKRVPARRFIGDEGWTSVK